MLIHSEYGSMGLITHVRDIFAPHIRAASVEKNECSFSGDLADIDVTHSQRVLAFHINAKARKVADLSFVCVHY